MQPDRRSKFLPVAVFVAFLAVFSVFISDAHADSWVNVGSPGFSAGGVAYTAMAFDPSTNEPYVAYQDAVYGNKATVKRFNGTSWMNVGSPGFSAGEARYVSIAFNPSTNEPYVAYMDIANGGKATVKRFNGTSWVTVGVVGLSAGSIEYMSIAFNPSTSQPYVAYEDYTNWPTATVRRFNGSSWVDVGTPGFSAGYAHFIKIAFNPSTNQPYVAYQSVGDGWKATVKRFDGSSWVNVGSPGFSPGMVDTMSLAFNPLTNQPYVAFMDEMASYAVTVMGFNGSGWGIIGSAGFSIDMDWNPSLAFNPSTSQPYVAYMDVGTGFSDATVMRYNGSSWEVVGIRGFSAGGINYPSLAFNPVTYQPYVAYQDGGTNSFATVMRFNSNTAPNTPLSLGPANLVDGSTIDDLTPTPTFTLTDPNSGDTVRYRIQIDDMANFSSPVVDYTGALQAQGSASFTVGQAQGSGSYAEGSEGQTLSDASYYWRVMATDDGNLSSGWAVAGGGSVAFIENGNGIVIGNDLFPITLDINSTISIGCDTSVSMNALVGTGKSTIDDNNLANCTITTNNSSGYKMEWQASADAMLNAQGDSFPAYSPSASTTPETWSIDNTESAWGAKLAATSEGYNGGSGGSGYTYPGTGWGSDDSYANGKFLNVAASSPFQIMQKAIETDVNGETQSVMFTAEIGHDKIQPTGSYAVNVTITATTL